MSFAFRPNLVAAAGWLLDDHQRLRSKAFEIPSGIHCEFARSRVPGSPHSSVATVPLCAWHDRLSLLHYLACRPRYGDPIRRVPFSVGGGLPRPRRGGSCCLRGRGLAGWRSEAAVSLAESSLIPASVWVWSGAGGEPGLPSRGGREYHNFGRAARRSRSPRMSSIWPSADRRSSAISWARMFGSGRFALSSRLSSRSQNRSRLTLSRATISS